MQATVAASLRKPFLVGVNMPWGSWCGHDFGLHPHGWDEARQDWDAVERELKQLRALGITLVRWFLLASGVNYPCRSASDLTRTPGSDGQVPQAIDDHARRVPHGTSRLSLARLRLAKRERGGFEFEWTGQPAPLSEEFLSDFIMLCRACQNADVQLMPSLLSFEWFQPATHKNKGVYGGGRGRLIFGPRADVAARVQHDVSPHVRAFLNATLKPLLERTTSVFGAPAHKASTTLGTRAATHPIFAWESINEPDWVTEGGPRLLSQPAHPVRARDMNLLLREFGHMVRDAGYDHSIGFKQFAPRWLEPSLRALLQDDERYWHQGHHYPTLRARGSLEDQLATNARLPARAHAYRQCLVGELASGQGSRRSLSNWPWADPELGVSERDRETYLAKRLTLIAERGYDGALLWSAKADERDPRNAWNDNTRRQVASFCAQQSRTKP